MKLLHLQFFALWSPGENLGPSLLDRMTVLCPWQHALLGGAILETQRRALLLPMVVGSFGWWWCGYLGADGGMLSLLGWPSRGLGLVMRFPKSLSCLPSRCGELPALGGVSARLCSMTTQLMPRSC